MILLVNSEAGLEVILNYYPQKTSELLPSIEDIKRKVVPCLLNNARFIVSVARNCENCVVELNNLENY